MRQYEIVSMCHNASTVESLINNVLSVRSESAVAKYLPLMEIDDDNYTSDQFVAQMTRLRAEFIKDFKYAIINRMLSKSKSKKRIRAMQYVEPILFCYPQKYMIKEFMSTHENDQFYFNSLNEELVCEIFPRVKKLCKENTSQETRFVILSRYLFFYCRFFIKIIREINSAIGMMCNESGKTVFIKRVYSYNDINFDCDCVDEVRKLILEDNFDLSRYDTIKSNALVQYIYDYGQYNEINQMIPYDYIIWKLESLCNSDDLH